ncbi:MAG: 5'/3'-nucleotidase SurE [Puniceicoccales bacterium]
MDSRKHILVTNDDGIDSYFLQVLVAALVKDFRVTVAAPMGERSLIGRAFSRHTEVHFAENEQYPCKAYALDGTPSDCVNIALGRLIHDDRPDLVCSGINVGFNACAPLIFSSGTIAGALEGAAWGLPAIALSHYIPNAEYEVLRLNHGRAEGEMDTSLRQAAELARGYVAKHVNEPVEGLIVHNYNFPGRTAADSKMEQTEPSPFTMQPVFDWSGPASFAFKYADNQPHTEGAYDWDCLMRGNISYTRLDFGRVGKM